MLCPLARAGRRAVIQARSVLRDTGAVADDRSAALGCAEEISVRPPETRYARMGDVSIAYQVLGEGPDLIMVPMFVGHLDLMWTEPGTARFIRHAASFARIILFDMPGTGLSDRVPTVLTLDERVAVIRAVLDAVGSESATVAGYSEGGQASILFAATYPERTRALILYGAFPKYPSERDLPEMFREIGEEPPPGRMSELVRHMEQVDRDLEEVVDHWGEGRSLDYVAGGAHSELERRFWAVFERAAAGPSLVRTSLSTLRKFDVRDVLPAISAPTLIFQPERDEVVPEESGRYLASRIPGAKLVNLPGAHHGFMFSNVVVILAEIERFLTGVSREWDPHRVFAAVLFTDIVGSTHRAAEIGDRNWRELLERHVRQVHERVEATGGRVVNRAGDGFLIAFEGSADAIRCAEAICTEAENLGIQVRAGVHSGECEFMGDELAGLGVHVGARVCALANANEVLVSSTVRDLAAESGIAFDHRGVHRLKGVPGEWQLFAVQANGEGAGRSLQLSPDDHLTRRDRLAVRLAGRAPVLARAATRMVRLRPGRRAFQAHRAAPAE